MKGNSRKPAVLLILVAVAMVLVVGRASADQTFPKALRGEYAATMVMSGIFSNSGFDSKHIPLGPSSVSLTQNHGVFIFEKDGTGSAMLNGSSITVSPSPPSGGTQTITFDFTYTVTKDGMITISYVSETYLLTYITGPKEGYTIQAEGVILTGQISPDGKNINLIGQNLATLKIFPPDQQDPLPGVENNNFSQSSTSLIWQQDIGGRSSALQRKK